jgi:hypothetical protein
MKHLLLITAFMTITSGAGRLYGQKPEKIPGKQEQVQDKKPKGRNIYKGSFSVLGGITMAGLQGEYTFIPEMGIRAVGLCILGADFNSMNRDEYIVSAIITPVLHLAPELEILDPVLMLGLVYSFHHWESKAYQMGIHRNITVREGNLHDVTFGAGLGFNFKFADRFKTGINLWLNYDYGVVTLPTLRKKKGNRIILPVPIIEFTVQF